MSAVFLLKTLILSGNVTSNPKACVDSKASKPYFFLSTQLQNMSIIGNSLNS